jgi:hypothetical protein
MRRHLVFLGVVLLCGGCKDAETSSSPPSPPPSDSPVEAGPAIVPQVALSCTVVMGAARAAELATHCLAVSPEAHWACNAQNPCVLIVDEMHRGCAALPKESAPPFCTK